MIFMSDPARELYDIAEAAEAVADTASGLEEALTGLAKSKGLTVISRLSSGIFPGFWSIQNKIRAVFDVAEMYYKSQEKSSKALIKNMKALKSLGIMEGAMPTQLFEEGYFQDLASGIVDVGYEYEQIANSIKDFGLYEQAIFGDKAPETDKEMTYVLKEIRTLLSPQHEMIQKRKEQIKKRREFQKQLQEQYDKFGIAEDDTLRKYFIKKKVQITNMIKSIPKNLQALGKFALSALKFLAFGFVVFYVLFQVFKNAMPALKVVWGKTSEALGYMMQSLGWLVEGISLMVRGLFGGDLAMILEGLGHTIAGLFGTILFGVGALVIGVLGGLIALIAGPMITAINDIYKNGLDGWNSVKAIARGFLQIVMIGSLIAAGILWFMSGTWIPFLIVAFVAAFANAVLGRATGGVVNEGMTLVGERGPELVSLPAGSRVYTNNQSRRMGGSTVINVNVSGRVGASDAEIKDIANKVAREINLRMNRTATTGARF